MVCCELQVRKLLISKHIFLQLCTFSQSFYETKILLTHLRMKIIENIPLTDVPNEKAYEL